METGRRFFLSGLSATLTSTLAAARPALAGEQGQRRPSTNHIPDASGSGDMGTRLPPGLDPKAQLKESQKILRRDVDRLLQMAQNLKEESDKTPETDVLSLSLVKKVEDIEKLARQIRDRIRAS
jgi:hypothetical protein